METPPSSQEEELTMHLRYLNYMHEFANIDATKGIMTRFIKGHAIWPRPNAVCRPSVDETARRLGTVHRDLDGPASFRIKVDTLKLVHDPSTVESTINLDDSVLKIFRSTSAPLQRTTKTRVHPTTELPVKTEGEDLFIDFIEPKDVAMEDFEVPKDEPEAPVETKKEETSLVVESIETAKDLEVPAPVEKAAEEPETKEDVEME
jgi:hypothetical protein